MVSVSPFMLLLNAALVCIVLTVADIAPPPPPIIARRRRSFSSTAIIGSGAGACSPLGARRTSGILAWHRLRTACCCSGTDAPFTF